MIRLQRRGRTNDPSFRVLVVEKTRGPKSGQYLEMVGSYDPRTDRVELEGERIKHWISKGAQVSGTVHNLLISKGIIEGKKKNVLPRKSPIKKEGEGAAQPAQTGTEAMAAVVAGAAAEGAPAVSEAPADSSTPEDDTKGKE